MSQIKRLQQAIYQGALVANRFQGSGGGSGMLPILPGLELITTDTSVNIATAGSTTYSTIPGISGTLQLGRTQSVLVVASIIGRCQAGGGGTFAYGKVHIDGTPYGSTQGGVTAIFDSGCVGYVPNTVTFHVALLSGNHTFDARIATDNTSTHWLQYTTRLTVYLLGA